MLRRYGLPIFEPPVSVCAFNVDGATLFPDVTKARDTQPEGEASRSNPPTICATSFPRLRRPPAPIQLAARPDACRARPEIRFLFEQGEALPRGGDLEQAIAQRGIVRM